MSLPTDNRLIATVSRLAVTVATVALIATASVGATGSGARAAPAEPARSHATPVVRTPEQLRREYLVAAHFDKVRGRALYETAIRDSWLNIMYQQRPNLDPAEARRTLDEMWTRYRLIDPELRMPDVRSDLELRMSILNALSNFGDVDPTVGAVAAVLREFEQSWQKKFLEEMDADERVALESQFGRHASNFDDAIADDLVRYAADAEQNEKYRDARSQIIGTDTGVQLHWSIERILQSTPALAGVDQLRALAGATAVLQWDVATLTRMAQQEFARLNLQMAAVTKTVKQLAQSQQEILAFVRDEQKRRQKEREAAEKAASYKLGLDGSRATVYVLSTLIGLVDPKLGREIQTIGNATIQVVDAIVKYAETIPKLIETGAKLGQAFAAAVLTGNIVQAVLSVVSLFVDSGPTPEQMILNEVRELKKQVGQLRTEMHDRFDRIDRGLNAIYETLVTGLNQINETTRRIDGGVVRLTQKLTELQTRLDRFEANFYEVVSDAAGRSIWTEVARALGFKETGQPMTFERYFDHATNFRVWATQFAFDTIAAGPSAHPLDQDAVVRQLAGPDRRALVPLDKKLNYLADYVALHWPDVERFRRGPRLPSPNQWALGARSFASVALDWPEHAARVPAARTEEIERVGKALREDLGRISRNQRLFRRLFANHDALVPPVVAWIGDVERAAITELGLDPFGGAMQTAAKPEGEPVPTFAGGLPACGAFGATLAPPTGAGAVGMLPTPHRVARYLARHRGHPMPAHDLGLCWEAEWTDVQETETRTTGTCISAIPVLRIKLFVDGRHIRTHSLASGRWGRCSGPAENAPVPELDDVGAVVTHRWTAELRDLFSGSANRAPSFEDEAFVRAHAAAVEREFLVPEQRRVYMRIADALETSPEGEAPRRLSGATLLLDAFVSLGLPRALERDELLKALLRGDQGILNEWTLVRLFRDAAATVPSENLRLRLATIGKERRDVLLRTVERYIRLVVRGQYKESHAVIEIALGRLRAAEAAARPPDRVAPQLLTAVPAGQLLPAVLAAGVRMAATCSEVCEARLALRLPAAAARSFGFVVPAGAPAIVVGQTTRQLPATAQTVIVPFTQAARTRLAGASTLQLTLRVVTRDANWNESARVQPIVLRR